MPQGIVDVSNHLELRVCTSMEHKLEHLSAARLSASPDREKACSKILRVRCRELAGFT